MHGIQGTCSSPWLVVYLFSMKLPLGLVTSAAGIDIATNGSLGNWYHADAGVEAWQSAKWIPTLTVRAGVVAGVVSFDPQSPHLEHLSCDSELAGLG